MTAETGKTTPDKPPLLAIEDLSVHFLQGETRTVAVDRISFTVGRGETVALVGESGSGKSVTALSVLKLLPYPSAEHPTGKILLDGKDLLTISDRELRKVRGNDVTMIFQEPMSSLNPLHTISQQIGEILTIHRGMSGKAAEKRILELLAEVGIRDAEKRLNAYPHQLSGGQRQRVGIASAIAAQPRLLIADEPTSALDMVVQSEIVALLDELVREDGMTLLFITHDIALASGFADRIAVFRKGRLVEAGPAIEVLSHPKDAYTASLITDHIDLSTPPLIAGDTA